MREQDRAAVERYMGDPLDTLLDELEMYAPPVRGIGDVWSKIVPTVHQILCIEGKWCEVSQHRVFDDNLAIALYVANRLMESKTGIPIDADNALIAVIAVKKGMDRVCGCPDN